MPTCRKTQRKIASSGPAPRATTSHLITRDHIVSLAYEYQFLHPHIAFPDIHQAGGFDAVVGNPPWEQIQYDARETFAVSHPHIASATDNGRFATR